MEQQDQIPFRPSRQAHFTDAQRWALLLEYDQCLERGSKAAFCRRIGVSKYTMQAWARMRAEGTLVEPAPTERPQDRRATMNHDERQELRRLRRKVTRLEQQLEQSQAAADLLGKAAALLEGLAKSANQNRQPTEEPPTIPGRPAWLSDADTSMLPSIPPRPSRTSE